MDAASFDQPYTVSFESRAARDRGLAITGHHIYAFGSSLKFWKAYWEKIRNQPAPPLSVRNLDALTEFWAYHIESTLREKCEVIWLLGFRGDGDKPFWRTYTDAPTSEAERAALIHTMLQNQADLLKRVTGDPVPPMRVTLYAENSDLYFKGLLQPPPDSSLIVTFVSTLREHYPSSAVQRYQNVVPAPTRKIGYYLNLQYSETGAHLLQAEGPWKMEANYRYVNNIGNRPLELSVVNVGNVREYVLEASAHARMMWDFTTYQSDSFLQTFCETYFGKTHASAVASLYRRFYDAYWQQRNANQTGFERAFIFQDLRYARGIEHLMARLIRSETAAVLKTFPNYNGVLNRLGKGYDPNPIDYKIMDGGRYFNISPEDNGVPDQLHAILNGTTASIARITPVAIACDSLLRLLPGESRPLFNDNLRLQAHLLLQMNRLFQSLTKAVQHSSDGAAIQFHVQDAKAAAQFMDRLLTEGQYGPFRHWYSGDTKFGVARIIQGLDTILGQERVAK